MNIDVINIKNYKVIDTVDGSFLFEEENAKFLAQYYYIMKKFADSKLPLAHTKDIAEVQATGKKPFKQKGTGNARQGSEVGPHHRGGGVAHGPRAKRSNISVNSKTTKKAKRMGLYKKMTNKQFFIFNEFDLEKNKTKLALECIKNFNITNKDRCIFIGDFVGDNFSLAFRNLPNVSIWKTKSFTVHELFKAKYVFVDFKSIDNLKSILL